jgi:hypothetical protein
LTARRADGKQSIARLHPKLLQPEGRADEVVGNRECRVAEAVRVGAHTEGAALQSRRVLALADAGVGFVLDLRKLGCVVNGAVDGADGREVRDFASGQDLVDLGDPLLEPFVEREPVGWIRSKVTGSFARPWRTSPSRARVRCSGRSPSRISAPR